MKRETETRTLAVKLTPEEIRIKSDLLAQKVKALDLLEEEKKAKASAFKTKLEELSGEVRHLAQLVDSKEERRDIQCAWQPNFGDLLMELVRSDTGEVVDTRAMSEKERQVEFPIGGTT